MTKVRIIRSRAAIGGFGVVLAAALSACRPEGGTDSPDGPREKVDLDGLEASAGPQPDGATPAAPAAAADKAKGLPKARDRDPEEEKKKLALSHQRSAEAQKHLEAGRLVEAIDHSRQALRIHEQNVEAMLVMAEAYYRQKKFELVQAVTSSALAVDEKVRTPQESSRAHNLKGFAYTAMGQDNLATQAFRKAAEADDKNAAAWNNLGTRYMQAGDIATAKQCFAYALELDPRFAKAHLNFGAALRAEGKWQDAEKSFDTALKLRPNYPEAYFDLGVLYLDADPYPGLETIGRLEKAIAFLTKYRELAIADGPEGPSPTSKGRGPKVAPGPAAVSKARAEDYIRVAKKGIEREQRRIDREKARGEKKPAAADAGATEAAPAGGDAVTPSKPGGAAKPSTPAQPGAGDPGTPPAESPPTASPTPSKPTPVKPGGTGPTPTKPGASTPTPSEPAPKDPPATPPGPQKPGTTAPSEPAPKQPAPQQPAPQQPTAPAKPTTPAKPTNPTPPSGGAPAPQQPSPPAAKPSNPTPPPAAPQKPGVQKPGGVAILRAGSQADIALAVVPPRVFDVVQIGLRQHLAVAGNPLACADTHRLGAGVSGAPRSAAVLDASPRAALPSLARARAMATHMFDHPLAAPTSVAPRSDRMTPASITRSEDEPA